jgi:hypothetical protein
MHGRYALWLSVWTWDAVIEGQCVGHCTPRLGDVQSGPTSPSDILDFRRIVVQTADPELETLESSYTGSHVGADMLCFSLSCPAIVAIHVCTAVSPPSVEYRS